MSEGHMVATEPKVDNASTHVEGFSKRDEAAIAVAEEHRLSVMDVLLHDKRIVFWCFFFSMSAIGWCVIFQYLLDPINETWLTDISGALMPKSTAQ
jgi:hypothetical protein